MLSLLVGWLGECTGWLFGWLMCWLFVSRLGGCLVVWLVGWLIGCLVGWGWLEFCLVDGLILGWLMGLLVPWWIGWMVGCTKHVFGTDLAHDCVREHLFHWRVSCMLVGRLCQQECLSRVPRVFRASSARLPRVCFWHEANSKKTTFF